MTAEQIALGLLTVILLAQQFIWAKICFNLINRLMSRSYFEFEQAQALKFPKAQTPPAKAPDAFDIEDERQAQSANALLGLV